MLSVCIDSEVPIKLNMMNIAYKWHLCLGLDKEDRRHRKEGRGGKEEEERMKELRRN